MTRQLIMKKIKILWADDEIDMLKIHILFLKEKGYEVITATSGYDAIEIAKEEALDIVFLDENMPGISGIETLQELKKIIPAIPVVMITKSEEEQIMEDAIGAQIADYLIKPVNPNQILLSLKKNLEKKNLVSKTTTSAYQTEFRKLGIEISNCVNFEDFVKLYKSLVFWELELDKLSDAGMYEVFQLQKNEANSAFSKFIKKNYLSWFDDKNAKKPLLSPNLFRQKVFPLLNEGKKVFVILIDNFRYDQWKIVEPIINEYFKTDDETLYSSILPTTTQYARNSIFAGLMPSAIAKIYPDIWSSDEEEGGKNLYEPELLESQMNRNGIQSKFNYEKIINMRDGKKVLDKFSNLLGFQLNILVYNFIDMLSHARTEMDMIKELANDEAAYRSLTISWFQHSDLLKLLKELHTLDVKVVLTTDHGSIKVNEAVKVIGDKKTSSNLRYKLGRNLNYNEKQVFSIAKPELAYLPSSNISSKYIFALNSDFFVYPNNYNHFANYYKNTFQHGGISLEEMVIPVITLSPK